MSTWLAFRLSNPAKTSLRALQAYYYFPGGFFGGLQVIVIQRSGVGHESQSHSPSHTLHFSILRAPLSMNETSRYPCLGETGVRGIASNDISTPIEISGTWT